MRIVSLPLVFAVVTCSVLGQAEYLEVRRVTVKSFGANSLLAKEKALGRAERLAFGRLIDEKFSDAVALKNAVSKEEIQDCIYDYSIDQEKFAGKTYIARFSFRFSDNRIRNLLQSHSVAVPNREKQGKVISVVVYTGDYLENPELFKDCNIVLFSQKITICKINTATKELLENSKVKFEIING